MKRRTRGRGEGNGLHNGQNSVLLRYGQGDLQASWAFKFPNMMCRGVPEALKAVKTRSGGTPAIQ